MYFLVFEGLDGAGKSTLIEKLRFSLADQGLSAILTREPGGSPLGEKLRDLVLADGPVPMAELFMYEAARAQHVEQTIRPALKRGEWVLCDRFTASTLAFQQAGRGLDPQMIKRLNLWATQGLEPDLTVFLNLSLEESLRRRGARDRELDRFEAEGKDFHRAVQKSYLAQAEENKNWLVLDAHQSPDRLLEELLNELKKRKWLKA